MNTNCFEKIELDINSRKGSIRLPKSLYKEISSERLSVNEKKKSTRFDKNVICSVYNDFLLIPIKRELDVENLVNASELSASSVCLSKNSMKKYSDIPRNTLFECDGDVFIKYKTGKGYRAVSITNGSNFKDVFTKYSSLYNELKVNDSCSDTIDGLEFIHPLNVVVMKDGDTVVTHQKLDNNDVSLENLRCTPLSTGIDINITNSSSSEIGTRDFIKSKKDDKSHTLKFDKLTFTHLFDGKKKDLPNKSSVVYNNSVLVIPLSKASKKKKNITNFLNDVTNIGNRASIVFELGEDNYFNDIDDGSLFIFKNKLYYKVRIGCVSSAIQVITDNSSTDDYKTIKDALDTSKAETLDNIKVTRISNQCQNKPVIDVQTEIE